jgi:hypothetical protein
MGPGFLHTIGITAHEQLQCHRVNRNRAQPRLRPILRQLAAFVLAAAADD